MDFKTIYVGNLPYQVNEEDIAAHFAEYGADNVRIVEGRGFAFVEIDADKYDLAIQEKSGAELGGRRLVVNGAHERTGRQESRW